MCVDMPCAFSGNTVRYKNSARQDEFKDKCQEIASDLLHEAEGKTREKSWVQERTLGYGNKGYLIVFPYNVPTQTLTLLWRAGKTRGWDWLPLLPRRTKT